MIKRIACAFRRMGISGLFLSTVIVAVVPSALVAARQVSNEKTIVNVDDIITGGPAATAKSPVDTIYAFGGPGTLEGKFQDSIGLPDRQGWTGFDFTRTNEIFWSASNFNAALLDTTTPGNHAWWCGTTFTPCDVDDPEQGYGNSWVQPLVWADSVPDPLQAVSVRVTAILNLDTEGGYDFLYLQHRTATGYHTVLILDGRHEQLPVDVTIDVQPADYQGIAADEVELRWYFISDGLYSDEDCLWPTDFGAAQIDLITVSFDQGAGPVQMGPIETVEPGDESRWVPSIIEGVGDFSKVWFRLTENDPCVENFTPAFAFLDDGQVVPDVGPTYCESFCYGPENYVVNHSGGRLGEDQHIHNIVMSPAFPLPPGGPWLGSLDFDVFRHNGFPVGYDSAGIFYIWHVRSTADPTGAGGWSDWADRNFLYEGGPDWKRHSEEIGDLLVPEAQQAQIALGVYELGWVWGLDGSNSTPAPYFDNVAFKVWSGGGPSIEVYKSHLANDGFPSSGVLDLGDLASHSVRFDAALNADSFGGLDPGDSVVIRVYESRDEATLVGTPQMHYRLKPNPLFDPYRSSGLSISGTIIGQPAYNSGYPAANHWAFDLPDTAFFFPGDEIHYYFEASQDLAGTVYQSILPADTTGFSRFPAADAHVDPIYDPHFTARALPTLAMADSTSIPDILFWDDGDIVVEHRRWRQTLANLGLHAGVHYDIYTTRSAGSQQANGLGRTGTVALLSNYETMLYASAYTTPALSGATYAWGNPNPAPDVAILDAWLRLGDRRLLLTGDRIVDGLEGGDATTVAFLDDWIEAQTLGGSNLFDDLGAQLTPLVNVGTGNPVFTDEESWRIQFCHLTGNRSLSLPAVAAAGNGVRLASYLDAGGDPTAYPYAAAILSEDTTYSNKVVTVPYGLWRINTPGSVSGGPLSARARLVASVLDYLGHTDFGTPTAVPSATTSLLAQAWPNPFNPNVTISYSLPRNGNLRVRFYNVRGKLVRTLHDGPAPAGSGSLQWNGTGDSGRKVATGLYFCEVRSADRVEVLKLALIK